MKATQKSHSSATQTHYPKLEACAQAPEPISNLEKCVLDVHTEINALQARILKQFEILNRDSNCDKGESVDKPSVSSLSKIENSLNESILTVQRIHEFLNNLAL